MKRKIRLEELATVIFEDDVTADGSLRKKYMAHIGRITRKGGQPVAIACGKQLTVRWSYYFNPASPSLMSFCETCLKKTASRIEGFEWSEERRAFSPASNTGVNSP